MEETEELSTTDTVLAAVVLAETEGSYILSLGPRNSGRQKRMLHISYPTFQHEMVQYIIQEYQQRNIFTDLFAFIRCFIYIENSLRQWERSCSGFIDLRPRN